MGCPPLLLCSYEGLPDLKQYLQVDDRLVASDYKSGYSHFFLAPDCRTLFGVEILGEYFVYKALPFGWSPACQIFTAIMTVSKQGRGTAVGWRKAGQGSLGCCGHGRLARQQGS